MKVIEHTEELSTRRIAGRIYFNEMWFRATGRYPWEMRPTFPA